MKRNTHVSFYFTKKKNVFHTTAAVRGNYTGMRGDNRTVSRRLVRQRRLCAQVWRALCTIKKYARRRKPRVSVHFSLKPRETPVKLNTTFRSPAFTRGAYRHEGVSERRSSALLFLSPLLSKQTNKSIDYTLSVVYYARYGVIIKKKKNHRNTIASLSRNAVSVTLQTRTDFVVMFVTRAALPDRALRAVTGANNGAAFENNLNKHSNTPGQKTVKLTGGPKYDKTYYRVIFLSV